MSVSWGLGVRANDGDGGSSPAARALPGTGDPVGSRMHRANGRLVTDDHHGSHPARRRGHLGVSPPHLQTRQRVRGHVHGRVPTAGRAKRDARATGRSTGRDDQRPARQRQLANVRSRLQHQQLRREGPVLLERGGWTVLHPVLDHWTGWSARGPI